MIDGYLDKLIGENLLAKQESEKREGSGKLSASKLYWPLQWQILATKFKLKSNLDEYTLRKFQRGKDVEEWFIKQIKPVDSQKFLEYRGVIGFCDSIVDTKEWENNIGIIPLEVKSVTNMKFKRIVREDDEGNTVGEPDRGHVLQNALYALALEKEHHAITYIASDDYRVATFICKTAESKEKIDQIIDEFQAAYMLDTIPKFEPREKWQADIKYNNFPEYAGMTEDELKEEYKKLKQ